MKSLDEVLKNKLTGLCYGKRVILPFSANFLKIVIDDDVITDFSDNTQSGVIVEEYTDFTNIYFLEYKKLQDAVGKFKGIKMLLTEYDKDIFDFSNHRKIILYLKENHIVEIEEPDEEIIFID